MACQASDVIAHMFDMVMTWVPFKMHFVIYYSCIS